MTPAPPTVRPRYGFRAIESSSARLAAAESLTAIAPCTPRAPGSDDAPMVESIARCSAFVRGAAASSGLEEQARVGTDRASRSGSIERRIAGPRGVGWRQGSIPCGVPSTRTRGRAPATLRAPPVTNGTSTSDPDRPMSRLAHLAAIAVIACAPLTAQAQSAFTGRWDIAFVGGMRMENDESTPIMVKGLLTITETADSLIATLKVTPPEGMPERPASRFAAAKPSGSAVSFVQRSQATLNTNGEERTVTAISNWSFTVTGDALTGTVTRELEGMMGGMPASPVTGTRAP